MGTWSIPTGFLDWLYTASPDTQSTVVSTLEPIADATQSVNDSIEGAFDSAGTTLKSLNPLASITAAWSGAEPWVIAAGIIIFLILIIVLLHQVGEVI
jgi:hypothetical protein